MCLGLRTYGTFYSDAPSHSTQKAMTRAPNVYLFTRFIFRSSSVSLSCLGCLVPRRRAKEKAGNAGLNGKGTIPQLHGHRTQRSHNSIGTALKKGATLCVRPLLTHDNYVRASGKGQTMNLSVLWDIVSRT